MLGLTPIPTPSPVGDALAIYNDNGNGYISWDEVRACGGAPVE